MVKFWDVIAALLQSMIMSLFGTILGFTLLSVVRTWFGLEIRVRFWVTYFMPQVTGLTSPSLFYIIKPTRLGSLGLVSVVNRWSAVIE